jgi:hypothetical protein
MAVTMKNVVFWDVAPCGSCKNRYGIHFLLARDIEVRHCISHDLLSKFRCPERGNGCPTPQQSHMLDLHSTGPCMWRIQEASSDAPRA